ncbi:unknown protein [Seminavis robusta]|uniref:Uncharacterized protein n=1 Tax=Seminavis robusta TaxID=568900 RepID=A0A9N8EP95_9STRA|nr:unknown protein [Seminavis robusta]|eukprot:Sro1681_g290800.1 n/a (478) ;mRNA; f:2530-3963
MPVALHIKTQLAKDIQKSGGIQALGQRLEELLNRRENLYGQRGSAQRRQIQNLVQYWKKLSPDKYCEVVVIPLVLTDTPTCTESGLHDKPQQPSPLQRKQKQQQQQQQQQKQKPHPQPQPQPQPQPPQPQPIPTRTTTTKPTSKSTQKNTSMKTKNELGKILVVQPKIGLYFCIAWVDSKLSNLEICISDDRHSVILRSKKPKPKSASALLSQYGWAADSENVVVSAVNDELKRLMPDGKDCTDDWKEKPILTLDEEVIPHFVDYKGNPTQENEVLYECDEEGRQMITFFLKSVDSHRLSSKGMFVKKGRRGANPEGMDIGSDGSYCEETVDSLKAEVDNKLDKLSDMMMKFMQVSTHQQSQFFAQVQQQQQPPAPQQQPSNHQFNQQLPFQQQAFHHQQQQFQQQQQQQQQFQQQQQQQFNQQQQQQQLYQQQQEKEAVSGLFGMKYANAQPDGARSGPVLEYSFEDDNEVALGDY